MTAALGAAAPTAAFAHPPGHKDREVLAQPAVVFIETSAQADVVLHDASLLRATYDVPVLTSGSGVVVNRSGTVVTASPVVSPDLTRAKVYAVNQIFARRFGLRMPGDPFRQHRAADPRLNQKLQGCYAPDRPTSDCVVFVRPRVRVFPFLAAPSPGITAEVLRAGSGPTDAAVLAVPGVNMPTVALAPTMKGATAVNTLGFATAPRVAGNPASISQHLTPAGATKLTAADVGALRKGLPNPAGAVLIGSTTGAAVGLIGGAPGTTPSLIPIDTVRRSLQTLGISPARSAVDTDFASAHSFFAGNHFSHAVPRLQEVLRLYPGHALAARELQAALQKKGTAADDSELQGTHAGGGTATSGRAATGDGGTNLVLLYVGLGLLAAALVLAFFFGRRVSAGRQRLSGLRLSGLRLSGLRLPRLPRLGRSRRLHTRDGGELAEPRSQSTPSRDAGSGGAAGKPTAAGPTRSPAPAQPPSRGFSDRADLTVQRPRVALPDGGVPVPEQAPREGARASSPPRPAPPRAGRPTAGSTPAPGVATTATRAQFCTQCGMKMAPEHRFCGFCGHDAGR